MPQLNEFSWFHISFFLFFHFLLFFLYFFFMIPFKFFILRSDSYSYSFNILI